MVAKWVPAERGFFPAADVTTYFSDCKRSDIFETCIKQVNNVEIVTVSKIQSYQMVTMKEGSSTFRMVKKLKKKNLIKTQAILLILMW